MNKEKIIGFIVIGFLILIAVLIFIEGRRTSVKITGKTTTVMNPIQREMSRNKYERDLSRKHGRELKKIFDYVDR